MLPDYIENGLKEGMVLSVHIEGTAGVNLYEI